jgi:hypothetical protein
MNYQYEYHIPIKAILFHGKSFYFFEVIGGREEGAPPQLFLGEFPDGRRSIELGYSTDPRTFVRQTRDVCDALYYIFLRAFDSGLSAYWSLSVERGKAQGRGRESTPKWYIAKKRAREALQEANSAWRQFHEGKLEGSKASAERAAQYLAERYVLRCFSPLVPLDANCPQCGRSSL